MLICIFQVIIELIKTLTVIWKPTLKSQKKLSVACIYVAELGGYCSICSLVSNRKYNTGCFRKFLYNWKVCIYTHTNILATFSMKPTLKSRKKNRLYLTKCRQRIESHAIFFNVSFQKLFIWHCDLNENALLLSLPNFSPKNTDLRDVIFLTTLVQFNFEILITIISIYQASLLLR